MSASHSNSETQPESLEAAILYVVTKHLLEQAWRKRHDNKKIADQLDIIMKVLVLCDKDVQWIYDEWKALYEDYKFCGGRGQFISLNGG